MESEFKNYTANIISTASNVLVGKLGLVFNKVEVQMTGNYTKVEYSVAFIITQSGTMRSMTVSFSDKLSLIPHRRPSVFQQAREDLRL
jgi:hypothetical protein